MGAGAGGPAGRPSVVRLQVILADATVEELEVGEPPAGWEDWPRLAFLDWQAGELERVYGERWMDRVNSWVEVP
jgi:hypothetical protein